MLNIGKRVCAENQAGVFQAEERTREKCYIQNGHSRNELLENRETVPTTTLLSSGMAYYKEAPPPQNLEKT